MITGATRAGAGLRFAPEICSALISQHKGTIMRNAVIALSGALLLNACAGWAPTPTDQASPTTASPQAALDQLMADTWSVLLDLDPHVATYFGSEAHNALNPDLSPEGIARGQARVRALHWRLLAIDADSLSAEDQLNYQLLKAYLETGAGSFSFQGVEFHAFKGQQLPLHTMGGVHLFTQVLSFTPFEDEADYRNYLTRLSTLDTLIQQNQAQLTAGLTSGWTLPQPVARTVIEQMSTLLVPPAGKHPLFAPFERMPASIPAATRNQIRADALAVLINEVLPAYQQLRDFMQETYLPQTRSSVAASDLPGGPDYYQLWVRKHTTTQLSADEIHQIGLSEVRRIRAEMNQILTEIQFDGDLAAFGEFLRNDPRFYYQNADEVMGAHLKFAKRIDPLMTRLFSRLPRMPYGIKPMPEAAAKAGGPPYYNGPSKDGLRAGYFFINTLRPELQPSFSMPALVAHEAVPGHHFQIAIAQELGELPEFRRNAYYTAYSEGWALYAETLGDDLGFYQTPYERFGRLASEIWRAIRLVVDTGMHAKGWSREQAIEYFASNSPEPQARIVAEVDRYLSIPGQALGYKMGQLKITELRERASKALGEKFDLRAFHDEVLRYGALPLNVLEQRIEDWVARQK